MFGASCGSLYDIDKEEHLVLGKSPGTLGISDVLLEAEAKFMPCDFSQGVYEEIGVGFCESIPISPIMLGKHLVLFSVASGFLGECQLPQGCLSISRRWHGW